MKPSNIMVRLGDRVRITPAIAIATAVAVLVIGLGLALYSEKSTQAEKIRWVNTRADILAASLSAPLAFEDRTAATEYINAMRADPDIAAVGAYDAVGGLTAGYVVAGPALPARSPSNSRVVKGREVAVTLPVSQGGLKLGSVYLRATIESPARQAARYLALALLVVMASLLVAVLGASSASVSEAHAKLQQEIRDRELAEEALRQAQKMEAMGQLTGGVAHDFNNLLMVASSGLDLMDRTTDPARRERLKQGIRQAIDRGADLTQQLLAFARRTPLKTEVVDLGAQLAGMRDLLERSLRENVTIRFEAAPDLWPAEVDPSQFEVAVLNIALNARDAMPNGGQIGIQLDNLPAEDESQVDRIRVAISDTGVGVPPDLIPRLFEPFFTTKGVGKGTGLGLSQVYGFARASGGSVEVESELGQGTTVSILLPRSIKPVPRRAATVDIAQPAGQGPRHILLVEDDDRVAELVGEMLHELGYEVTRAPTAAQALDTLRPDQRFDLVFSDMVMPGEMSGLDLAREIARTRPHLPVVLTTGYSASAAAAAAEGLRLLVKPYRIDALAAELQAALGQTPPHQTRH